MTSRLSFCSTVLVMQGATILTIMSSTDISAVFLKTFPDRVILCSLKMVYLSKMKDLFM